MAKAKQPIWYDGVKMPTFPSLAHDIEVDVCIVGGGISGVTAAYMLSKKGLRVALIEKGTIASGATGATTAFLSSILDTEMTDLISIWGLEKAKQIIQSHRDAIRTIEQIVRDEKIKCEFMRCPAYMFASAEDQKESVEKERVAALELGYNLGAKNVQLPFTNFGAFEIRKEGKFHPLKYLSTLLQKTAQHVAIYEKTCAIGLDGSEPYTITTEKAKIKATYVFLATYEPFTKPLSLYFKKAFYVSYIRTGTIKKGAFPEGTYEDFANPYNYFRIDSGDTADRIVLGGADHRSDVKVSPRKNYAALQEFADRTFPAGLVTFDRTWRGPILEPLDGLAYIGQFGTPRLYMAMGFSGNGMTYGTLAASMFANHVLGDGSPYTAIYELDRLPGIKSLYVKGRDYFGEFFGGAVHNALHYK